MRTWPLALVLVAGTAAADPAPAQPAPATPASTAPANLAVPAPAPAAATEPVGVDARARRPGAERGYIFASALNLPAGAVEVDVRALTAGIGVLDVEAGLTQTTELTAEAGLIPENGNTLATEVEQVFAHTSRIRVAVLGTLRQVNQQVYYAEPVNVGGAAMPLVAPFDNSNTQATNLLGLGGVGTACLDAPCEVEITAGAQAMIPLTGGQAVGVGWGDLSIGNQSLRAVGELLTIGDSGAIGLLGLRGGWQHVGVDLAVTFVPTDSDSSTPMIYLGLGIRP